MFVIGKRIILSVVIIVLILAGCGSNVPPPVAKKKDLLAKIRARGTIIIATDAAFPPQSELIRGAKRAANTKCASNDATADEYRGFDVATAVEIAKRLGVEACFVTPEWPHIIAGRWDGRWDISVGSMAITDERLQVLYFTQPYYAAPATIFVHQNNVTLKTVADLSGKRIGVCTGCTYEDYLRGILSLPANPIDFVIKDPRIVGYRINGPALEALAKGDSVELDAVVTDQPTGLQAIADGLPIKQIGEPIYFEYLATAIDKSSDLDSLSLAVRVTEIIREMHADGTLVKLSKQFYQLDYATVAGKFNIQPLGQMR